MSEKTERVKLALAAVPSDVRAWLGHEDRERIAKLCEDPKNSPTLIANEVARDAAVRLARAELRSRGCFDSSAHDAACRMIFEGVDPIAAVDAAFLQATQAQPGLPASASASASASEASPSPISKPRA